MVNSLLASLDHSPILNPAVPQPLADAPVRHAPFVLNSEQQVNKIVADATIKDCEFCTNNSESNVNIKCSTGFYKAVAHPAFSTLSPGFSHKFGEATREATVTVSNIEPSLDYRGVEYNRIFWFTIKDSAGIGASVTIHLHHTTRLWCPHPWPGCCLLLRQACAP